MSSSWPKDKMGQELQQLALAFENNKVEETYE